MKDFNYFAPTEVVFGKSSEEQVACLVKKYGGSKVLVHYGGQSAVRSGLLDKICSLLSEASIPFVTLGGVVPNPRLSLAQKGIELCRKEGIDFILAVGGGQCHRLWQVHLYGCSQPRHQGLGDLSNGKRLILSTAT